MSCLFKSIGSCIKKNPNQVRNEICTYLEENNSIIEGLNTKNILDLDRNKYIESMRNTTTSGGGIEIAAASNIYRIRICIYSKKNNPIIFIPLDNNYHKTINLFYTGNHFMPYKY